MKLREALKIIVNEGDAEFIRCPFCLYSRLADLIGADYCGRDALGLLFTIDRRLSLVKRLMENDISEVARIREEFSSLHDVCNEATCGEILDMVASVLVKGYISFRPEEPNDFDYGFSDATEEKADAEEKIGEHLADERERMQPTAVAPKPQTAPAPAPAPATGYRSYGGRYVGVDFFDVLPWLGGGLAVAILIAGGVCLGVFAKRIQWFQWQYIIGSVGGLLVCGLGFLLSLGIGWLFEEVIATNFDGYSMGVPIVIVPLAIANFVLAFVFGRAYIIIFYWMSGYLLLASAAGMIYSFCEYEKGAGIFGIVDTVVVAAMLVTQVLLQVF